MDIIFYVDGLKLCSECFSNELVYDERRDETYCNECGLILKDSTMISGWEDTDDTKHETIENFRQSLYINYDKEVVDNMIRDIFNQ